MQTERKFRGWNKDSIWVYGQYYYSHEKEMHLIITAERIVDEVTTLGTKTDVFTRVAPKSVGESMYIKDKLGNELFDGDEIISDYPDAKVMVLKHGVVPFCYHKQSAFGMDEQRISPDFISTHCTRVGNKWESSFQTTKDELDRLSIENKPDDIKF